MKNNFSVPSCLRSSVILLLSLVISYSMNGQDFPEPMVPFRLVNDFTGLLTEQQQLDLNNKLLTFNNETSTQIYVVTYDSLQGFDIADYGARLGEKWGIGQKGKDNGILLLVSPINKKISIQTGYGLEGAVPDAICRRLIESVIKPGFREGKYYAGLDSATSVLMSLTRGEFKADDYLKGKGTESIPVAVIIVLVIFFIVFSSLMRVRRRFYSPTRSIPWWMLLTGGAGSGGWGSFSSGSGSFGGSGGGGFGGFGGGGGGSFGGGGASGGW